MKNIEQIIRVSKGSTDADLVLKNARLVNVLSEEIYETDIAITGDIIAGISKGYRGKKEIDLDGAYVSPSFIDGHVHLESSMLLPSEFARLVVPSGTTTVVADPHEISNVMGLQGISFMREATKNLPLDVYMTLPSCVPATNLETSGVELNSYDLALLIDAPWVLGIAEMMNFPGVIEGDNSVLSKIKLGLEKNKRIDGHAPHLCGKNLDAYVAAGIASDHECTTAEEAIEKLRLGMHIMVREATGARDLEALAPVLKDYNTRKCMFVTDDRHPKHLKQHISKMVKKAVSLGVADKYYNATSESFMNDVMTDTGDGFDVVVDCCGNDKAVTSAFMTTRPGGTVVLVGVSMTPITIPTVVAVMSELTLKGAIAYTKEEFQTCIALISNKKIDVTKFIDDVVGLEDVQKAYERLTSGTDSAVKILVDPNK